MRVFASPAAYHTDDGRPAAVAIGMFDGVHLGHRTILSRTVTRARELDAASVVYTFTPHPHYVMRGRHEPFLLTSDRERLQLLEHAGVDAVVLQEFTLELAGVSAEAFVRDNLAAQLGARAVVVGFSHVFGRGGEGTPAFLRDAGTRLGFSTDEVEPVRVDGEKASSTAVRSCVRDGRLDRAAALLGRPYDITGTVVRGDGRGRTLGAPTANIVPEACEKLVPGDGIYLGALLVNGRMHDALVYCGRRPSVGGARAERRIEAFVLDYDADLYGHTVTAVFHEKLRDDRRFETHEALAGQIRQDRADAVNYFKKKHEIRNSGSSPL